LAAAAFEEYYKAIKNSGDQKMIKDFEANSMPIMKKVALALGAAERAKAITHLQPS
jgi:biotin-(acetyl-CoA carboxylase) ligase